MSTTAVSSTGPAAVPSTVRPQSVVPVGEVWQRSFRAMATTVGVQLGPDTEHPQQAFAEVAALFADVEAQCTRFDAGSDLMRANAAGTEWCAVGPYCLAALTAAAEAHERTDAMFDPRVLRSLTALGYDRSQPFAAGGVRLAGSADGAALPDAPWRPRIDVSGGRVAVGAVPVDLGGIGKGLAVRWAAELLAARSPAFCLDAGGDCYLGGDGPDGDGWQVGVEDPFGGTDPVAVLTLRNTGCATSSIRLRNWQVDGAAVHHLIDPRTGAPGGAGLLAVTVVDADPAAAEVWSKTLFLHGRDGIGEAARRLRLSALWVDVDAVTTTSELLDPLVVWRAS